MTRYRHRVWLAACLCILVALFTVAGTLLWVDHVATVRRQPVHPARLDLLNLEESKHGRPPLTTTQHATLVQQYWVQVAWIALPVVAVGTVAELVALAVLIWALLSRRRHGVCPTCGYPTQGNVSGRCPECGSAILGRADSGAWDNAGKKSRGQAARAP